MGTILIIAILGLGFIILPILAFIIIGGVGGFVMAKVVQRATPNIANSDVAQITRGWVKSFAIGGAIAAIFFGIAIYALFERNYLMTGISMTIGLAIVGRFAGRVGANPMLERLMMLTSISESRVNS